MTTPVNMTSHNTQTRVMTTERSNDDDCQPLNDPGNNTKGTVVIPIGLINVFTTAGIENSIRLLYYPTEEIHILIRQKILIRD